MMIDEVKTERVTGDTLDGVIAGSSLLVFSVDPQWGNIYFWLGRERKNTKWPQGSETWSDFGGRPSAEDEDAPTIAAREFWEETGGMLRYFEDDEIPRMGMDDIVDSLRRREYVFQITMWTEFEKRKRYFVTFVKQIPWTPSAAYHFSESYNILNRLRNHMHCNSNRQEVESKCAQYRHPSITSHLTLGGNVHYKINKDFLEKKAIRMWSIPQLRTAIDQQLRRESGRPGGKARSSDTTAANASSVADAASAAAASAAASAADAAADIQKVDRFRSCFIPMMVAVLRELPYYEPMCNERPDTAACLS